MATTLEENAAATTTPGTVPPGLDTPVPESEDGDANSALVRELEKMKEIMKDYEQKLRNLQKKLDEQPKSEDEMGKEKDKNILKPIHVKDVKPPPEYDCEPEQFVEWHERFKVMLATRHESWKKLLEVIEKFGEKRIKDKEMVKEKLEEDGLKAISEQYDTYAMQLYTYLNNYTKGNLHARVIKGQESGVMDIYRDVVHKGKNLNANRMIKMKASILQPQRATKPEDLDKIIAEWKFDQRLVTEFDGTELTEEQLKTILMTIMPKDHVEYMRDHFFDAKFEGNYYAFEQELYNRIDQRRLDDGGKKTINAVTGATSKNAGNEKEYEEAEMWSQEWQCWICGLAPKRDRDEDSEGGRDRSRSRERPEKKQRYGKGEAEDAGGDSQKGKGKRQRVGGPCWTCGGAHFQRECPHKGKGKGGNSYPHVTAWSSWRPGQFPGPSPAQWKSWLPKPFKGKGKGKGKGGGKGKGKGAMAELTWGPQLGQLQMQQDWYGDEHYGGELSLVSTKSPRNEPQEWTKVQKKGSHNEGGLRFCISKIASRRSKDRHIFHKNTFDCISEDSDTEDEVQELKEVFERAEEVKSVPKVHETGKKMKMPKPPKKTSQSTKKCGGSINMLSMQEEAMVVKEKCRAERLEAEEKTKKPAVMLHHKPINAVPNTAMQSQATLTGSWQLLELAVDSGAAETVIPHDLVLGHPIVETEASAGGLYYASATGQPIPNLGEQWLPLATEEGTLRGMTFQAAPVSRPLGSVKKICKSGHTVVFDEEGSYIMNKATGEVNWMREEDGNYIMDLWVIPQEAMNSSAGFGRQR